MSEIELQEIKIGEYVRTKNGIIAKLIEKNIKLINQNIFYLDEDLMYEDITMPYEEKVVKHSKELIDLIEDEDIVKLEYYVKKYGKRITRRFECLKLDNKVIYFDNKRCSFCYDFELKKWRDGKGYNPKIKEILTHQQYNANKFVVESED